jgi:abequosyltransferase
LNQDTPPLLSICIPTRNRADCLRELLHSIASQYEDDVEIVLSDDDSTDHTSEVVESFRSKFKRLQYSRSSPALRYDRNVLHLVGMARGRFCWLFGDDDRIEPGGLAAVLKALRSEPDLTGLTTGRVSYDSALSQRLSVRSLKQTDTMIFTNAEEALLQLLDRLGFLSCQVVNRAAWNAVVESDNLEPYFAGYVQLYIIARMLKNAPRWEFLAHESVGFRSDNDSFRVLGIFGRLKMDVCGYEQIIGDVFGRASKIYRQAMAEIAVTHARHHIVMAKRARAPLSFPFQAIFLCLRYYWRYPGFWLTTFPVLLMPRGLALGLRSFYQKLRSGRRAALLSS